MREWAFYGHPRAAVHDSTWHHFAVAYDDEGKRIIGWRDGELIAVVDLSQVNVEPLKRTDLTAITIGKEFAGFMDDLRIYNRVLADREIRDIYSSAQAVFASRFDTNPTDRTHESYTYQEEDHTLYRAWQQYPPLANAPTKGILHTIVAAGSNTTVNTAARELKQAMATMLSSVPEVNNRPPSGPRVIIGTVDTSPWIREHAGDLGLERIQTDGFILKTVKDGSAKVLVVAGRIPAGCVFGVFDLIRRLQLGQDPEKLDVLETPRIPIRMVDHWSHFSGFPGDNWRGGGRDDSIYNWQALRSGDTRLIRDWVRLLASAGWNAICPSEVNWDYRDNFLDHLDEVQTLAAILRDYGMTLYWSPSYLLSPIVLGEVTVVLQEPPIANRDGYVGIGPCAQQHVPLGFVDLANLQFAAVHVHHGRAALTDFQRLDSVNRGAGAFHRKFGVHACRLIGDLDIIRTLQVHAPLNQQFATQTTTIRNPEIETS